MYNLIIIGGGPAGSAAAVYAARKQLKTLIIAKEWGGQSIVSAEIYNWIGNKAISGAQLAKNLKEHIFDYQGEFLDIEEGIVVTEVSKIENRFNVLAGKKKFEGKTILIASGSGRRKLDIQGAGKYEHKGVVYCATCDGPLFAGKNVAVVGGGNAGFESAAQLSAYCNKVYIIHRGQDYKADKTTVEKVLELPNVEGLLNTEPIEVLGSDFVENLKIKNKIDDSEKELAVGGVFVEIGQIPNSDFVGKLVEKDNYGRLIVDPKTQATRTSGIWAAGDITDGLYHQNNIAAGDAIKAIEDIYLFLRTR